MNYGPLQIYSSMLRFVSDFILTAPVPLRYHAWDGPDEEAELPNVDLIGLAGWSYRDDDKLLYVSCGVTLSTINDINLMRETRVMDELWQKSGRGMLWPVRDMTTGDEINSLSVSSFEILPGGKAELRNYRSAGVELLLTAPRGS